MWIVWAPLTDELGHLSLLGLENFWQGNLLWTDQHGCSRGMPEFFFWWACLTGVRGGSLACSCIGSSLGVGSVELKKLGRSSGWSLCFLPNWIHWVMTRSGRLSIRSGPLTSSWMESASSFWKWSLWLDSSSLRFLGRSWKVVASCWEKLACFSVKLSIHQGVNFLFCGLTKWLRNSRRNFSYCFNRALW